MQGQLVIWASEKSLATSSIVTGPKKKPESIKCNGRHGILSGIDILKV